MHILLVIFLEGLLISSITYLYLHKKTRISLKYLYKDNLVVAVFTFLLIYFLYQIIPNSYSWIIFLTVPILVLALAFSMTMIRFWRTPSRKVLANKNELISPADGNVLYIKRVEKGEVPISIKKGLEAKLNEIVQTDLIKGPCWLIGINMTPFDVHKNCAPIEGKVILNKHTKGKYLSLKEPKAIIENERNTLVLKNENDIVGIVQTASKLVRRIDSYVKLEEEIKQGQWFGMIRFGSQVDLIIPISYKVEVELGEQIYAVKTIIARK